MSVGGRCFFIGRIWDEIHIGYLEKEVWNKCIYSFQTSPKTRTKEEETLSDVKYVVKQFLPLKRDPEIR